jgi:hypothetical protein
MRTALVAEMVCVGLLALAVPACSQRDPRDTEVAPAAADSGGEAARDPLDALIQKERAKSRRETSGVAGATADSADAAGALRVEGVRLDETIRFAVPDGWSPSQGDALRRFGFNVSEGPLTAEATVMGLPGSTTRLLTNVNLWRKQLGLPETTQEELAGAVEALEIGGRPGHYIEIAGPPDVEKPQGMLVVLAGEQDRTWFFRMTGDRELVQRQKDRFREFVRSVTFVPAGGDEND